MATPAQRVKSIFDALLNSDVPNAKILIGVEALLASRPGGPGASALLTTEQKCTAVLDMLLTLVKSDIRSMKAQVGISTATASAAAETDTDFAPVP